MLYSSTVENIKTMYTYKKYNNIFLAYLCITHIKQSRWNLEISAKTLCLLR